MKVFTRWLNDYFERPLSLEEITEALEKAGVEVEGAQKPPAFDDSIVVAEVEQVEPHPNADELRLVTLSDGTETYRVVCGAANVASDQHVPLVKPGSQLPGGTQVETATIRGEESEGMIASAKELSLGEDHQGILVLDSETTIGLPLNQVLSDWAELDVTVAANRVDIQSMLGLAQEVAVHSNVAINLNRQQLLDRAHKLELQADHQDLFANQEPEHFQQYLLADISFSNIHEVETPAWMRNRLQQSGVRPLHPIIDVTNFVMLELGQPLHAFDKQAVELPIQLRFADNDEKITTIDQVEHSLTSQDLVIADSQEPIAVAGVMGGSATEVSSETTDILLEAAVFKGVDVRKSAIRHGIRTEASGRFERNLPSVYPYVAMVRALELFEQLFDVEKAEVFGRELSNVYQDRESILVSVDRFRKLAGIEIENQTIEEELPQLGFEVESDDDFYRVRPPYWRPDVTLSEDVFEEVIKLVGLEKLPTTLPDWRIEQTPDSNHTWHLRNILRELMVGLGLYEVTTYPFLSKQQLDLFSLKSKHLKVQNPRSEEQAYLRRNLLGGLSNALGTNTRKQTSFGLFEIGQVFHPTDDGQTLPEEPMRLGVIYQGNDPYWLAKNVLDNLSRRANIETSLTTNNLEFLHPKRQASVLASKNVGYLGELHPAVTEQIKLENRAAYLELDLNFLLDNWQSPVVDHISEFEPVTRDLTLLVGSDTLWQDVAQVLDSFDNLDFAYQDSYFDPDKYGSEVRAITIHLAMYDPNQTLTSQQADERQQTIIRKLTDELDVTLPT